MLTLDVCHVPFSVGVTGNVPGYKSGVYFVTEGNEEELVEKLMDYSEIILKFLTICFYKNLTMSLNYWKLVKM